MENTIEKFFLKIGLNKNEVKIYFDLLKNKNSSALDISKRTLIHRSNVYDLLRNLMSKGFVKENVEEKRSCFSAISPDSIKEYLKQQEKELDILLPEIIKFTNEQIKDEEVSIQRGVSSAREEMMKMLDIGEEIFMTGVSQEAIANVGQGFLEDFHKERIKKGIFMKTVLDSSLLERSAFLNKFKLTESKYISEDFYSAISTIICGDIVYIASFKPTVMFIKIKSRQIADTYRQYFEVIWQHAK